MQDKCGELFILFFISLLKWNILLLKYL